MAAVPDSLPGPGSPRVAPARGESARRNLRTHCRHVRHGHMHGWHAANRMSWACVSAEWHECAIRIMQTCTFGAQLPAKACHIPHSYCMPWCANGGGGAYLGEQTLGLNEHPAWEAGRAAQSRFLKSPAQTGQRHEPAVARRQPACWPMPAMVWA